MVRTVNDILWVQAQLRNLGFNPGPLDGVRGPRTDAAIVAFKRSIGFRARPYLGPLTMEALKGAQLDRSSVPWMAVAEKMRGLHEVRDRSRLRSWFSPTVAWIDPREVPWCGAFVATCFRLWQPAIAIPDNPLGARNWRDFGQSTHPAFGSLLVFWRGRRAGWQGHVGFYHAEDQTHFHVLGGNQSDAVTVSRIAKTRLLASRWPLGEPITGRPVHVTPGGIPTTTNEA